MRFVFCLTLAGVLGVVVGAMADNSNPGKQKRQAERKTERKVVLDAVRKAFPHAKVRDVEREREDIPVLLYEVEIMRAKRQYEVLVTPDGTIVAVSQEVNWGNDLPDKVAAAVKKLKARGRVTEIEMLTIRAEPKFQPLAQPRTVYQVEFIHRRREYEARIDKNGNILSVHHEDEDDDDEDDDDRDDDDRDDDDRDDEEG